MYEIKPAFQEYLNKLLPDSEDMKAFFEFCKKQTRIIIRCNTLKISPQALKKRLEDRGWKISQVPGFPEAFVIESKLGPGELGRSIEHQTGLYYVQELSSMMSALALDPQEHESVLDLCASPGSKTTQMAMMMKNTGFLLANDVKIDRIRALSSNLERCGCMNVVISRMDGVRLCEDLASRKILFDKVLVDAPCSGEGIIRSDPKVWTMYNPDMIRGISALQKKLVASALKCLKPNGILVYSTCTFEPEEDEKVIQFALEKLNVGLEEFDLPLKTRKGLKTWQDKEFSPDLTKCKRVFPQDNDTEGFFVAKLRKL